MILATSTSIVFVWHCPRCCGIFITPAEYLLLQTWPSKLCIHYGQLVELDLEFSFIHVLFNGCFIAAWLPSYRFPMK